MKPRILPLVNTPPSPLCDNPTRGPIIANIIENLAASLVRIATEVEVSRPTAMIDIIVKTITCVAGKIHSGD